MNVALYLVAVPDLSGGGGAERQFSNFYEYFNSPENKSSNKLYLITDRASFVNLKKAGLIRNESHVIVMETYQPGLGSLLSLSVQLLRKRIRLLHVVNTYTHYHFYLIYKLAKISRILNTKISVNNEVAELIDEVKEYNHSGRLLTRYIESFKIVLNNIRPSGIYTWYESVARELKKSDLVVNKKCVIKSSQFCFTDLKKFVPGRERKNHVVYASRLCKEKNPLILVDAIRYLKDNHAADLGDYKFLVYGRGELEDEMKQRINELGVNDLFEMSFSSSMQDVFAVSKVFVSTQPIENFTSLSMMEAMACGNIIVAKNAGQTHLFAKQNENGFLYEKDEPKDLALALRKAIMVSELQFRSMSEKSIDLATKHHTVKNFSDEIEMFFEEVLAL